MDKHFSNQSSKSEEERILGLYEKLLNWGVKRFFKLTEDYIGVEDIKQEGRIVIVKLIREYDPSIGTLDGYIKSLFYKKLKRALGLDKKKVKVYSMENETDLDLKMQNFEQLHKQILIERLERIKEIATEKELEKIQEYLDGKKDYSYIRRVVYKIKKRLEDKGDYEEEENEEKWS